MLDDFAVLRFLFVLSLTYLSLVIQTSAKNHTSDLFRYLLVMKIGIFSIERYRIKFKPLKNTNISTLITGAHSMKRYIDMVCIKD